MGFKKIYASDSVHVEAGYFTNRVWIFKAEWLDTLKGKETRQLRNRLAKARLETVNAKIMGNEVPSIGVSYFMDAARLRDYRTFPLKEARKITGFAHGDATRSNEVVAFLLGKVSLDVEFFDALSWDSESTVMVRGETDPVFIMKGAEILGAICPMKIKK